MFEFLKRALHVKPETKSPEEIAHEEKEMREHLSEKQIDKTLQDSFPASDPPAWY